MPDQKNTSLSPRGGFLSFLLARWRQLSGPALLVILLAVPGRPAAAAGGQEILPPAPVPATSLTPAPTLSPALTPAQAATAIGQVRTVCGRVANTYYSYLVPGRPTFVNFGKPYPEHVFSAAVPGADRGNFSDSPEKLFAGREVCVTGLIESYDGKPLMTVKDQSQVEWQ